MSKGNIFGIIFLLLLFVGVIISNAMWSGYIFTLSPEDQRGWEKSISDMHIYGDITRGVIVAVAIMSVTLGGVYFIRRSAFGKSKTD